MNIVSQIRNDVMKANQEYINKHENFNFWEQHIKYVVHEALILADKYNADREIVELGALLHDIALIRKVGTKVDHHTNGVTIAREMLSKYSYPEDKLSRVLGCVLNHRSSKNSTNIEELCVADADILAHFDNISMIFECVYHYHKVETIPEANKCVMDGFIKDFNDLSPETQKIFKPRYDLIIDVIFGKIF